LLSQSLSQASESRARKGFQGRKYTLFLEVKAFGRQCTEETRHRRIIQTISLVQHTPGDFTLLQNSSAGFQQSNHLPVLMVFDSPKRWVAQFMVSL